MLMFFSYIGNRRLETRETEVYSQRAGILVSVYLYGRPVEQIYTDELKAKKS